MSDAPAWQTEIWQTEIWQTEVEQRQQAIAREPQVTSHYWQLGLLYFLAEQEAEAQNAWLSGMMVIDPAEFDSAINSLLDLLLTEAHRQLCRRPDLTEALCQQVLEISSSTDGTQTAQADLQACKQACKLLAQAVALQGRLTEAIEIWQQLSQQVPDWALPFWAQCQLWYKLGQLEQAIVAGEQAAALQPDWQTHYLLGLCLGQLQQWQRANQQFDAAVRLTGDIAAVQADLGWSWLWLKQPQAALSYFQTALVHQSNFAATYCDWIKNLPAANPQQTLNAELLQAIRDPDLFDFSLALRQRITHAQPAATAAPAAAQLTQPLECYETTKDWAVALSTSSSPPPLHSFTSSTSAPTATVPHFLSLNPPSHIPLTPPQTLDTEIHFSFRFGRTMPLPGSFVAQIPQGRVWFAADQSSTAVFTSDDQVLGDLSVEFPLLSPDYPDRQRHSALTRKLSAPEQIDATVVVLSGLTDQMYFHWIFDLLPRLDLIDRSGIAPDQIDYFLVNHNLPFQQQTLEKLGVTAARILPTEQHLHLQATRLIVPFVGHPAWMPRWACDFLRQTFLPAAVPVPQRRLYLSRQNAGSRRLINATAVEAVLSEFGFETVILEALTVAEQAALLSEAEAVIGLHGSGLTNLVFCQPGTKVIELFSANFVYPCYWLIANLLQLEYHYLLGNPPSGHFLHRLLYPNPRLEDVWLDVESLQALLEKLFGIR